MNVDALDFVFTFFVKSLKMQQGLNKTNSVQTIYGDAHCVWTIKIENLTALNAIIYSQAF